MNNQVTEYIENAPIEQKEMMKIIRELIHQNVPNLIEEFKWNRPVFKTTKDFAYFQVNKNYLTLGFSMDIDKIIDPKNKLEGTGKTMRHIKLKHTTEIDRTELKTWFLAITNN
ncbi:MAG: DUF1801 domain-containing protein [Saprospiraceae bacterium]|nr:MAG: hypothetical protein UZ09_BCD002001785 [Bacteroidetes bacterium OLB9]MCO6463787.1 DUF1801 domain-containing protein [Saprospiraceae bacterium]MCZ2338822.1 DUF1801 domain-containing protein [Chitinophagales bacterium]